MKPALQVRLAQHLALTPQLQQSIRLLQLSTLELHAEIERLLAENPFLERVEDEDAESGTHAYAPAAAGAPEAPPQESAADAVEAFAAGWSAAEPEEDGDPAFAAPATPTLREHLYAQLALLGLSPRDRALVGLLIDALDDDGYLAQPLEEIAAMLPAEASVELEELAIALRHLQNLEPAGVGARSPGECLALQLRASGLPTAAHRVALAIAERHLPLLAARDLARLRAATGADEATLREAQRIIRTLNPRPGAAFARLAAPYVMPDVFVRKVRGLWRASLNPEAVPRLRLHRLYAEIAAGRGAGGALARQAQEARWLIKNVRQRFDTILRVAQAIVDRQRGFFEHGEVAMRPMVLREIAEALGVHESTVSRVTTQKYMATPRGTFELKYFFTSRLATETGGAASSAAIRALIRQLVAAEDARAPLSDATLARLLRERGIVVARRTVAKYREALHIPPVAQRRSL
ncbi:MAG: RNA polymerase factor sigma-54 [Burkholderiales bacterium]|nr:RNA polymerase factor sigma-54 [Burkholderiales bacterium]